MEEFHLLGIGPVTLENTKYGKATAKGDVYCILDGSSVTTRINCNIQTSKGDKSEVLMFEEWIGLAESKKVFMGKLNEMMPEGQALVSI